VKALRIICAILILGLAIFVALKPGVVYAPSPRVILYFLVSFLPALVFGAEVSARFKLELPGFCFTTAGVFAACLGTLVVLDHLSKPQEKIAVFQVFDEAGEPVNLEAKNTVNIPITLSGLSITKFVDGNTVILIFPEQAGSAELRVKPVSTGPTYSGDVTYAGSRTLKLRLGQELKASVR
jgi:hypothetical protein